MVIKLFIIIHIQNCPYMTLSYLNYSIWWYLVTWSFGGI